MKMWVMFVVSGCLCLGSARYLIAEDGKEGGGKGDGPKGGKMHEEILKKFDKDGDGKLNDAEKAEAKAAMEARRAEMEKKMLAEFDKDGDGKLSDEEKAAAKAAREAKMAEHKKKMLEKFDKDGDGKLNDEEKAAAKQFMQEHKGDLKGEGKAGADAAATK